jgi:hypothetical protein
MAAALLASDHPASGHLTAKLDYILIFAKPSKHAEMAAGRPDPNLNGCQIVESLSETCTLFPGAAS